MLPLDPQQHVIGLLAGAGEYPRLIIEGAKRAGMRVVVAGFRGAVGKEIPPLCDAFAKFRVGAVEGPRAFFAKHGVTHVLMAGQIKPACIYTMWPDATARRLLAQLDRRNAHTIFGAVCDYVAANGMQMLPSTAYMDDVMPGAIHIAGPALSPDQLDAARHGMQLAREIARLDIGQSLMLRDRQVTCVEGFKGTNECIKNGGGTAQEPVMLCKVTKPGHDMRFDVPCIGLRTIQHCVRHHVRCIVFEAGRTIFFQKQAVIDLCNRHGITLLGMDMPAGGTVVNAINHANDDAAHAYALATALEQLGIGHSAVVCDGVVITVEDPQGPTKCIARAAAYMKRLRFARLANWLCGLFLGRKGSPPSPMVMRYTPAFEMTPLVLQLARKYGIRLM
ncbi:MAG: LpxI family protein [Akkermansiaceae bacterium]|nr:LpxI family protein [Akkermansiaceae bacterium]